MIAQADVVYISTGRGCAECFLSDRTFDYFLQKDECVKEGARTKVKIKKWLDIPDLKRYEDYISEWHYFIKDIGNDIREKNDDGVAKAINMYLLQTFFITPYDKEDFYGQFEKRMTNAKKALASMD